MKKVIFVVVTLFILLVLSACGPQPTPDLLPEGAERDAVLANSDVFITNLLSGIENNDLATFSKDFDATMIKSFTPEAFQQITIQFESVGKHEGVALYNVQNVGDYFAVRYKVTYPKKDIIFRVVINKNDPPKVSGLWFE